MWFSMGQLFGGVISELSTLCGRLMELASPVVANFFLTDTSNGK